MGLNDVLFSYSTEPIPDPIAISDELELRPMEIGEIIVSGWHVNTFQVTWMLCDYAKPLAIIIILILSEV